VVAPLEQAGRGPLAPHGMAAPRTPGIGFDLAALAPDLAARTTVRLHPRQGQSDWRSSKVGGAFAWPIGVGWPMCAEHSSPLVTVLQLRVQDVPELDFPGTSDLFQLVWCPLDHVGTGYAPQPQVFWRSSSDSLAAAVSPTPVKADRNYLPKPCTVSPERVVELPSPFELTRPHVAELDALIASVGQGDLRRLGIRVEDPLYQYHFSVAPGTKVRGYPHWIQDPEVPTCSRGHPMEHLLTVASAEFDGAYQRWMPTEERVVWHEDVDRRFAVQCAAGLMIGDMGSLYLFDCRRCEERPVKALAQSS
jgi:hypothetical protein